MNTFVLHLRDQKVGGAVTSGQLYQVSNNTDLYWNNKLDDFTALTRENRLVVLLHGFNNNLDTGRKRLVQFIDLLKQKGLADLMLAVLWPGDGWAKALTYPFEGRDADDTADALFKWLLTHVDQSARIGFIGHSLGCRVIMETIQKFARHPSKKMPALDRVCLMAPAIDNDSLGKTGVTCYRDATLASDRIAVLASEEDRVLQFAYPMGDLAQTILFGERWGSALGRTGPREKAAEILSKIEPLRQADPVRNIGHSDYLDIDTTTQTQTKALSDTFVAQFLQHRQPPSWPAQRN